MIEFALLFALGFLTAGLLGLLAAPVVHKRIVRFAEDRLKATMPLSPQEVRAQKDAARAGYAAENARMTQVLKRERDKNVVLLLENGTIRNDMQRLAGENADLHAQLADMNVEAGDLRSSVRHMGQNLERLKTTFADVEKDNLKKTNDLKMMTRQLDHLTANMDSLRIDAAASETEAENLKSRIAALRDERETARQQLKIEAGKVRELEARIARDESRVRQAEMKLATQISANADKENFLERRNAEVERLKLKVKETNADLKDAADALRRAGLTLPARRNRKRPDQAPLEKTTTRDLVADDEPSRLAERARNRAAALSERLLAEHAADQDDALRTEMAEIATDMVALTLAREGARSPIPALFDGIDAKTQGREKGLTARVGELIKPEAE